ncbi:MAG: bifunctional DNA-formamidopyrimidine glycosylase/DNA-(apurinic or apyrimidinic site) lyase [Bacillota bacterium]|nr:bifunctional DNA-formamidopyrimidine glycosylase/DNA-(apurinic or apyrimidinic site) lyase [Bacillota bacterium]
MPELPEVETIRRDLTPLAGRTITDVEVLWPGAIKAPALREFGERVRGQRITGVERRGKHLILCLASGEELIFHLRLTGRLVLTPAEQEPGRHTRAVFFLDEGEALHFADVRKFGTIHLVKAGERQAVSSLAGLAPEPLSEEFTLDWFRSALARRRGPIKGALLDQAVVAGMGNIYADEALFRAGLRPDRPVPELASAEVERLWEAIRAVLAEGIRLRGTSVRDYVDGRGEPGGFQKVLSVYGRKGQPCRRCGAPLQRMRVAGRGTTFCPHCQR